MSSSPRPILKRSETHQSPPTAPRYPRSSLLHNSSSPPHGVHFPPSPTLTRTFSAYSSTHYDRSPIVVTPNSCALPERGCPGRTYTLDDPAPQPRQSNWRSGAHNGRHLHPRAVAPAYRASSYEDDDSEDNDSQRTSSRTYSIVPPLIPDLSSESEESDGPVSSSPEPAQYPTPSSYHHPPHSMPIVAPSHPPIPHAPYMPYSTADHHQAYFANSPNALSFLPHPPSPKDEGQKARRRKQRDQSRSREERHARRVADESYKSLSVCKALSNCSLDDSEDGCLGGF
jgi:hypothetical protein